jgi:hypothetical protein
MHTPPVQVSDVPLHAGAAPQLQAPPAEHWLDVFWSQPTQVPPLGPQVGKTGGALHVVPLQQPLEQEVALQTQEPVEHFWPVLQTAPVPQPQPPSAPQLSAVVVLQAVHASPFSPQTGKVSGALHVVPPVQHPVGQEAALQTQALPEHCCPLPQAAAVPHPHIPLARQVSAVVGEHALQAEPPVPQLLTLVAVTQSFAAVQQPAQEVPSQRHVPLEQC